MSVSAVRPSQTVCLLPEAYDTMENSELFDLFRSKGVTAALAKATGLKTIGVDFFSFAGSIAVAVVSDERKLSSAELVEVEKTIRVSTGIRTLHGAIDHAASRS